MKLTRVLVVDDSFFMRKMITDLIQDSGVIEVIGTARNGLEAVELAAKLSPDVITLDVEMPKMNGLEALQKIIEDNPLPVIMLSSVTAQGTDTTIRALQYGAFDFIEKPSGSISLDINKVKNELIDKILLAASQKTKWIKQVSAKEKDIENHIEEQIHLIDHDESQKVSKQLLGVVAIGTSTGGPRALQEVLTNIPKSFPYAILVVQHMPAGFTKSLANRLDSLSKLQVVEAENGQVIEPGVAYIAPGNYHMTLIEESLNYQIKLNQDEPIKGHRPSVDIMFESLADISLKKVFVVMTGMGSDGANGIAKAKKQGDIILAEDESTSVVFGMPKVAINTGLVDVIAPVHHISKKIIDSVENQRRWQSWK